MNLNPSGILVEVTAEPCTFKAYNAIMSSFDAPRDRTLTTLRSISGSKESFEAAEKLLPPDDIFFKATPDHGGSA